MAIPMARYTLSPVTIANDPSMPWYKQRRTVVAILLVLTAAAASIITVVLFSKYGPSTPEMLSGYRV